MKKTLSLLLAAAAASAFAAEEFKGFSLNSDGSINISGVSNSLTVAITLDSSMLQGFAGKDNPIISFSGAYSGNDDTTQDSCMAGVGFYYRTQTESEIRAFAYKKKTAYDRPGSYNAFRNPTPMPEGHNAIKSQRFAFNMLEMMVVVMAVTENPGTASDRIDTYVYTLDVNGIISKYTGYYSNSNCNVIDPSTLKVMQYSSLTLFNGALSSAEADALANGLLPANPTPSVPEPTTATLSLLALGALAARRRRKSKA